MRVDKPSGLKIPKLDQIGLVVDNLDEVVRNYWNILGIGPWEIQMVVKPNLFDSKLHGKPADFGFKCAMCTLGSFQLELLETLSGETAYSEFLSQHGEGAHHLRYIADSYAEIDEHARIYASYGIPSLMCGKFKDTGAFHYFDSTATLKTVIEAVKFADNFECQVLRYPADEAEQSPARIKVKEITQVSFAVKDLEEAMANYWNLLGIGPWNICDVLPPDIYDQIYRGKPGKHTMRAGLCQLGSVEIELIQSLSGDTIYNDFISEHDEGITHLQFTVDDIEETNRIMHEEGFSIAQGGKHLDGAYYYYDTTGPLKIMWEAFKPPTNFPVMARFP